MTSMLVEPVEGGSVSNSLNPPLDDLDDYEFDYEHPPPISHITMPATNPDKESSLSSSTKSSKTFLPESGEGARADECVSRSLPETPEKVTALMIMRQSPRTKGSYDYPASASISNSDEEDSLSKTRRNLRQKYSSFRSDRNSFLEQTKSRSWSNLEGYDSASGSRVFLKPGEKSRLLPRNPRFPSRPFLPSGTSARTMSRSVGDRHEKNADKFKPLSPGRTLNPYQQYAQYAKLNMRLSSNADELEGMAKSFQVEVTEPNFLPPDIQAAPRVHSNRSLLVKPSSNRTKVSFSTVEVRQYERILGDNPGVSCGPPVSIGWNHLEDATICIPLDDYEYYHCGYRDDCEMILSREEREEMLLSLGFDQKEIARAVRINYKLKRNRRQTLNNLSAMRAEEFVEKAKKSVSRLFVGKKKRVHKKEIKKWATTGGELNDDAVSITTRCTSQSGKRSILKVASTSSTLHSYPSMKDHCDRTIATKVSQQTPVPTKPQSSPDRKVKS
jgi:hypothetical protein